MKDNFIKKTLLLVASNSFTTLYSLTHEDSKWISQFTQSFSILQDSFMVVINEMGSVTRVQILDIAAYISHHTNVLNKNRSQ